MEILFIGFIVAVIALWALAFYEAGHDDSR